MSIAENLSRIRERIARAAARVGRKPEEITLMGVTKTVDLGRIREAYAAGIRVFGENRVQELEEKVPDLKDLQQAEWRLIGHLQTNKARKAAGLVHAVDSVDSFRLAEKLHQAAREDHKVLPILIEIRLGGEESKSGLDPESRELQELLEALEKLDHLQARGLMTIPPLSEDPEEARPFFRRLRELRDTIAARHLPGARLETLSMGMSHDFETAIEEGSTCVRVGTAIFGGRPTP